MFYYQLRTYFKNLYLVCLKPRSWRALWLLDSLYYGKNPYRLSPLQQKESFTYGETPLEIYKIMPKYLKPGQILIDLGCGRGKGLFYLNQGFHITCMGYDAIADFIEEGSKVLKACQIEGILLFHQSLESLSFCCEGAIYLAGTCFEDDLLETLAKHFNEKRPQLIFSLSTALIEYGLNGYSVEEIPVFMPWGKTSLFILQNTIPTST
jgi:hypothetical protein